MVDEQEHVDFKYGFQSEFLTTDDSPGASMMFRRKDLFFVSGRTRVSGVDLMLTPLWKKKKRLTFEKKRDWPLRITLNNGIFVDHSLVSDAVTSILFLSSSPSGGMLYSVGDHVLPYSTVPCCFQDFNHLACSQPVVKSIGHLLSFPSAAFSFHHSCCYEMF